MKKTTRKIVGVIGVAIGILFIFIPLVSYYTTPIWLRPYLDETCYIVAIVFGFILICGGIIDYFKAEEQISENKSESNIVRERFCPACGRAIPFDAKLCSYCGKKFER